MEANTSDFYLFASVMSKVFFAVVCGSLAGIERAQRRAPAGFKTQILVCVGSAVFTIVAQLNGGGDSVARVIGQIVTGVGFLGAGAIIHNTENRVSGLTTAAWIWLIASMGVLCGLGRGWMAIPLTVLMIGVTLVARRIEAAFLAKSNGSQSKVNTETQG